MSQYTRYPVIGGGGGSGTVTGGASTGTGVAVFNSSASTSSTLAIKSLIAGTNITVTDNGLGGLVIAASGGSSGVTSVGAFSGSSQANGASIAGSTITFGPADTTNPGMVSTGTQKFLGAKTFSLDANNFVAVDPSQQSMVLAKGNNNANNVLFEAFANSGGTNEYSGYIFSTSGGSHVAGISVSGPNATSGGTLYPVNLMRTTSSLVNGMRWFTADTTANVKHDFWTTNSNGSASRLSINNDGIVTLAGNGAATNNLVLSPSDANYFLQFTKSGGQVGTTVTNTNAAGYNTHFLYNNLGNFSAIQNSGSSASFSIAAADQTQVFGGGAGGALLWAQAGPVKLGVGAGGSAAVPFQVKLNKAINLSLNVYSGDSAAITAGLASGDMYINSAVGNAITQVGAGTTASGITQAQSIVNALIFG